MIIVDGVAVCGVDVAGVVWLWALVGTVALLLALVACDVLKKSTVSAWCFLNKCHSVSCCVVGVPGVPIVVFVVWNGSSATVWHCHCMV